MGDEGLRSLGGPIVGPSRSPPHRSPSRRTENIRATRANPGLRCPPHIGKPSPLGWARRDAAKLCRTRRAAARAATPRQRPAGDRTRASTSFGDRQGSGPVPRPRQASCGDRWAASTSSGERRAAHPAARQLPCAGACTVRLTHLRVERPASSDRPAGPRTGRQISEAALLCSIIETAQ